MYRKAYFLFALLSALSLQAQNLQLHFDPRGSIHGDDVFASNYMTATFEMYKADQWGSTFMFVDADFNLSHGNIGMMYAEIARTFKINDFPLMPHIEFNGGLGLFEIGNEVGGGYSIPNAYLVGLSYPFQLGNAFMGTYVAYKYNAFKEASHDVQWTLTWTANCANNKLTLCGFADLWTENKNPMDADSTKKVVFVAEPQVWYNTTSHFSLGGEVEISSNFAGSNKLLVCPTLGMKWEF